MVEVKLMYLLRAVSAKEADSRTIKTTVYTVLRAEFALAVGENSSAFKSNRLSKECFAFSGCP